MILLDVDTARSLSEDRHPIVDPAERKNCQFILGPDSFLMTREAQLWPVSCH